MKNLRMEVQPSQLHRDLRKKHCSDKFCLYRVLCKLYISNYTSHSHSSVIVVASRLVAPVRCALSAASLVLVAMLSLVATLEGISTTVLQCICGSEPCSVALAGFKYDQTWTCSELCWNDRIRICYPSFVQYGSPICSGSFQDNRFLVNGKRGHNATLRWCSSSCCCSS